jgi:catechol 2,3-dioxygenase-like lactoylglutathione lyase family enzyme
MAQVLGLVSLVVHDYDQALAFYVGTLGFDLVEDSEVPEQAKRWVVGRPPGTGRGAILLARASTPEQVESSCSCIQTISSATMRRTACQGR